jgi:hypothetical protein
MKELERIKNASRLFLYYPQFREDIEVLFENEVMTFESDESEGCYKWNYSLTSLGEYFLNIKADCFAHIHWNPIESIFGIKKGTLRHLINKNGREFKREKSRDFEKMLNILNQHKKKIAFEKKIFSAFEEIKTIVEKTDNKNIDEVKKTLEKTRGITTNCLQI